MISAKKYTMLKSQSLQGRAFIPAFKAEYSWVRVASRTLIKDVAAFESPEGGGPRRWSQPVKQELQKPALEAE